MMQQEALMSQLALELDNGRLLRLLARLVMVSQGSQTSLEPNWSETGQHTNMMFSLTVEMIWNLGAGALALNVSGALKRFAAPSG